MGTQIRFILCLLLATCAPVSIAQENKSQGGKGEQVKAEKQPGQQADHARSPIKKDKDGKKWTVLFNGKDMKAWKLPKGFDYDDAGKVEVKDGNLVLNGGLFATGVRWPGKFPKTNYEVALEAQCADGYDFFCGMSFPVGDGALTLILGGWGGYLTGLSCVDGYRADENETCSSFEFKDKTWYRVRVQVTDTHVRAFVDDEEICELEREHRKLTVTSEMEPCLPFGFATWGGTTGWLRKIRYRKLTKDDLKAEAKKDKK